MESITGHWFWALMTGAAVLWYTTITVYVAIKGAIDIRDMLNQLKARQQTPE